MTCDHRYMREAPNEPCIFCGEPKGEGPLTIPLGDRLALFIPHARMLRPEECTGPSEPVSFVAGRDLGDEDH